MNFVHIYNYIDKENYNINREHIVSIRHTKLKDKIYIEMSNGKTFEVIYNGATLKALGI